MGACIKMFVVTGWCNRGRYPGRDVLFTSNSAFHAKSHHNILAICYLIVYLYSLTVNVELVSAI